MTSLSVLSITITSDISFQKMEQEERRRRKEAMQSNTEINALHKTIEYSTSICLACPLSSGNFKREATQILPQSQ